MRRPRQRVLFVQVTEAGGYPPIINATSVMAAAGWEVLTLNAPIAGHDVAFPRDCGVTLKHMPARPSHIVRKRDYVRYLLAVARFAASFRPNVVYASDPLGALPGLAVSRISRAKLVYHEHDSPNPGALDSKLMRFRAIAAKAACAVIFPNEARARIAQEQTDFRDEQLCIVWNMPRLSELPRLDGTNHNELVLYYHGNITPKLLPERIVEALEKTTRITLRIVGYEAPDARGYIERLVARGKRRDGNLVEYLGPCSRDRLITLAARAAVGLALFPKHSDDVNLRFLVGASNKVFDYMAAGLALLLPDTADWQREFIAPGYGLPCDSDSVASIASQVEWLASHPEQRRSMGAKARAKIESDWNYERAFAPVLRQLENRGNQRNELARWTLGHS